MKNFGNIIEKGPESDRAVIKYKELIRLASSVIELNFFRHGKKESDPNKSDSDIELTKEGGQQAAAKSNTKKIEQSLGFGSPRKRAGQTAGLVMAGRYDGITGEESYEQLKKKLDQDLKVGTKLGVDKRLDFIMDMNRPYDQQVMESFKKGEFLKFLFNDSDRLAKAEGIEEGITYSGTASEIAKIVDKYLKIAPHWDQLVADEKKKYSKVLERYLGSHQGVLETFLAKVIELTKGKEERNKFQGVLNNTGFDFVEGFRVNILNQDAGQPKILISYRKEKDGKNVYTFEEEITSQILKRIIEKK
jgi:hypothetical protein